MDTETLTVLQKGEDFEIIVEHDKSGSAYGITLSKNAYEKLRQHFVGRSPIFGIFRYDDKGYCGYFLSEESAQKVLDEEYNSDEWYVDEMVCQDCA